MGFGLKIMSSMYCTCYFNKHKKGLDKYSFFLLNKNESVSNKPFLHFLERGKEQRGIQHLLHTRWPFGLMAVQPIFRTAARG
jgi:hypothetical protein